MTAHMGGDSSATLRIRVQPKSSSNRLTVDDVGHVRIAVTAPPADGAANRAVCVLVAKCLGLAKSSVFVRSGLRSRDKVIQVHGLGEDEAMRRLAAC
jgi:hypothetical protein